MDNETLASLLRGRNRAGQPVDATANIIGPAMSALGNTIYGAGRGALTAMAGLPGDINQLITDNLGTLVNAQGLPTTKDIQDFLPLKPTSYEGKLAQKLGEFVPVNPTPIAKGAVAIAKPVGKAMGEQAYRMTEDMLQKQGMMPSIVAYHGTPHNIEGAFDISKVGTGEGAQAYGHGMYYAENPKVAEAYKTQEIPAANLNAASGKSFNSIEELFNEIKPKGVGNLYKVDIPDEYVPKMLDYDKPIKDQPELYKLIRDNIKDDDIRGVFERNAKSGISGANAYSNYINGKTDAERSANALKIGIKGIKYLDEGSRSMPFKVEIYDKNNKLYTENLFPTKDQANLYMEQYQKQGYSPKFSKVDIKRTSNFVVFDPKEVKILEKNSKPVSRKDIIEEQINKLEDYRGSHTAPNAKVYGGTLDQLEQIMPKDVYSQQGKRLYGINDSTIDQEWYMAALRAKGKPDAMIEVYRAVPKGVKNINNGDWVTTSKKYATDHGENTLNGEYEIVSKKVKANTLSSEGYPYEFGYNE